MKSLFHKLTLAAGVAASLFVSGTAIAQTQQNWVNERTDALDNEWTGYYIDPAVKGNWNPTLAPPGKFPGQTATSNINMGNTTDLAFFGNVPGTNQTPTIGINHTTTGGRLTLGGIGFKSTSITYSIGNSSVSTPGVLQLNGTTINTATGEVAGGSAGRMIVVADGATRDATIQANNNGGTAGMTLELGAANGQFYVTGSRQLNIDVAVGQTASGYGITKTGAGTMVLSRNNTFSGAVNISGGTLQVGNGGTTGDFGTTAATVNNSGVLAVNRTNSFTIANVIAGTGTVSNLGSGTTILTGNNSYGTTNISAGTIQVGNGSTSGTLGSGNVTNNGELTFNRSDNVTVGNTVNGTGQLNKNNSNVLTLTANHGFTGAVNINGGSLQLGNGGTTGSFAAGGNINVAAGATLAVNRSDITSLSAVTGNRSIVVAGNFKQAGPGSLQLNAALSVNGATTVDAGSLIVNNTLTTSGGLTVAASALLGGSGTIVGNVDMSAGGTLTPGITTGTLSVTGNLLLGSSTILNYELNENDQTVGGGINDLVAINGNLTLDGTLNVTGIPSNVFANTQKTWTLFTYTGVLTNNGLVLGSLPTGQNGWFIDVSNAGKVNLTAVPEPSSALLFTGLFAGAAVLRRRRSV
ncbi:MAG: autotransporter-associated beta strand repeat-containing protein [Planctomycetota bacterium]